MQTSVRDRKTDPSKKEEVIMKRQNHFYISRKYSFIPGLQDETEDTYEISEMKDNVIITYTCSQKGRILHEQKICALVSFPEAKNITVFLSENSCRSNIWLDIIRDKDISYRVIV